MNRKIVNVRSAADPAREPSLWMAARATAFAALCAFGMQPMVASAQITVTPTQGTTTTLGTSSNGTQVVNIATPNLNGVSNNFFTQYNVGANGVVLNNSAQTTQTQIGGVVQGNGAIGQQNANLILLQVNSGAPSQLLGATEVAGRGANVVLANPAGITCSGCGFLNAPRVTLTTGTPIMNGSGMQQSLAGFDVQGGRISVDGGGLSASASKLDLIARAITVNAKVQAGAIDAIAGVNKVDYDTNNAVAQNGGTGAKPEIAIDVQALGSMYGNGAVRLIGTEKGLGVRDNGKLASAYGDLTVSANGDVSFGSTASASAANSMLSVDGANVRNDGALSGAQTRVTASQALTNAGKIDGVYGAQANAATTLTNSGTLSSQNNLIVAGRDVVLDGGKVLADNGQVLVDGKSVSNKNGTLNAGALELRATSLDNTGGTIAARYDANITTPMNASGFDAAGSVVNAKGTMSAGRTLNVSGANIDNTDGKMNADERVILTAATLANDRGVVSGKQGTDMRINGAEQPATPDQGGTPVTPPVAVDTVIIFVSPTEHIEVPRSELSRYSDLVQIGEGRYAPRSQLASLGYDQNGHPISQGGQGTDTPTPPVEMVVIVSSPTSSMTVPRSDLAKYADLVQLPDGRYAPRNALASLGLDANLQPLDMVVIVSSPTSSMSVPRSDLAKYADLVQLPDGRYAPRNALASLGLDTNLQPLDMVVIVSSPNSSMSVPRSDLARYADLVQLPDGRYAPRNALASLGLDANLQPLDMVTLQLSATNFVQIPRSDLARYDDLVQTGDNRYAPRNLLISLGQRV